VARDKANAAAIDPIRYPNCCDCHLLFPLNHQLNLTEAHHHVLLQHLATNLVLLARAALATHLRPFDLDYNTAWMDGFAKQKGRGCHSGRGRKDGWGLLCNRCSCHSIVDGNKSKRNGCGHCSWPCSLRSGHRHVRLILALVGALGEPGALGDSDRGGLLLLCHSARSCSRLCRGVVLVIFCSM
jgi:hypothetical protein